MTGTISIAEKRLPQDGRIQLAMGNKDIDLRVSTVPTNHGEIDRHAYSRQVGADASACRSSASSPTIRRRSRT